MEEMIVTKFRRTPCQDGYHYYAPVYREISAVAFAEYKVIPPKHNPVDAFCVVCGKRY
jgi:hypothetical protein